MSEEMNEPTPLMRVFVEAKAAQEQANEAYVRAESTFTELQTMRGVSSGPLAKYMPLIKKYAPLFMAGGGGTAITAALADLQPVADPCGDWVN